MPADKSKAKKPAASPQKGAAVAAKTPKAAKAVPKGKKPETAKPVQKPFPKGQKPISKQDVIKRKQKASQKPVAPKPKKPTKAAKKAVARITPPKNPGAASRAIAKKPVSKAEKKKKNLSKRMTMSKKEKQRVFGRKPQVKKGPSKMAIRMRGQAICKKLEIANRKKQSVNSGKQFVQKKDAAKKTKDAKKTKRVSKKKLVKKAKRAYYKHSIAANGRFNMAVYKLCRGKPQYLKNSLVAKLAGLSIRTPKEMRIKKNDLKLKKFAKAKGKKAPKTEPKKEKEQPKENVYTMRRPNKGAAKMNVAKFLPKVDYSKKPLKVHAPAFRFLEKRAKKIIVYHKKMQEIRRRRNQEKFIRAQRKSKAPLKPMPKHVRVAMKKPTKKGKQTKRSKNNPKKAKKQEKIAKRKADGKKIKKDSYKKDGTLAFRKKKIVTFTDKDVATARYMVARFLLFHATNKKPESRLRCKTIRVDNVPALLNKAAFQKGLKPFKRNIMEIRVLKVSGLKQKISKKRSMAARMTAFKAKKAAGKRARNPKRTPKSLKAVFRKKRQVRKLKAKAAKKGKKAVKKAAPKKVDAKKKKNKALSRKVAYIICKGEQERKNILKATGSKVTFNGCHLSFSKGPLPARLRESVTKSVAEREAAKKQWLRLTKRKRYAARQAKKEKEGDAPKKASRTRRSPRNKIITKLDKNNRRVQIAKPRQKRAFTGRQSLKGFKLEKARARQSRK